MSKKAQTSIFIISGIVIVAIFLLIFLLRGDFVSIISNSNDEINPNSFLHSCIEDEIETNINIISSRGGYTENKLQKVFKFSDEEEYSNISFLCYTQNYYDPCVNQEPVLINHLEKEIKNSINEEVENCFYDMVQNMENRNYDINYEYNDFEVLLKSQKVEINFDGKISIKKNNETTNHEELKIIIPNRIYNIAVVVQEIVSQEAEYCNFDNLGYSLLYPEFKIEKFTTGNSDIIYTVIDKKSEAWFRFAVRSCIIPAQI